MNLEEILAIIDRIGSENPPSSGELSIARTELSRLLHAEARAETPDLAVMASIRQSYSTAGEALIAAEAAEAEEAQRVQDMLDGVEDPDEGGEEGEEETPPAETPPVEAGAEGEQLPPPEAVETPPAVTAETPPAPTEQPLPVAASGAPRTMPLRDAAARLSSRPQTPPALDEIPPVEGAEIFLLGKQLDHVPSITELANAYVSAFRSPSTGKQSLLQMNTVFDPATPVLGTNKAQNTQVLDEHISPEAVAASGGCCSLPTVIRTQNVLSSTSTPLTDSLPGIGVFESGAVMYYPALCLPSEGVWNWTCAEDELVDPDDEETWKNCTVIDCADEERTIVDAIYKCLTIGEFQRRFAPEQWAGVLRGTMALWARVQETKTWTQMLAGVTQTCTQDDTGSVFTNLVQGIQREADAIRDDQRYLDVRMEAWVSDKIVGAIASDFAARRLESIADPTTVRTLINNAAANANVAMNFIPDTDPMTKGDGVACSTYPDTFTAIVAPNGMYSYLNGGQFDLGAEIRDINLARQNAVAAFAEAFGAVLVRGCAATRINIPNTYCTDAAGCLGS
jgi:hypothetical protein